MAAPGGKYFIQDQLDHPKPRHDSFVKLWETKWKPLAERSLYPFLFGAAKDFEPIVEEMKRLDLKEPYNWEQYSEVFRPHGEKLLRAARAAEQAGNFEKASEFYLSSSAVWFISRYPTPLCEGQRYAWVKNKEACQKGLQLRGIPIQQVLIPHKYAIEGEGSDIPAFLSLPDSASKDKPVPTVLCICGLDAWRTEMAYFAELFRRQGVAMIAVEIPGTGDSPALANDPIGPDRQWSSVLDWLDENELIDSKRLCAWGISMGGYYAIRIAHTHSARLLGVACHGGGCHHMFDEAWLESIDQREYAHRASEPLSLKFGFQGDFGRFKREASGKFSLLKDGTLDRPCTRLLLVNGMDDSIIPIDDYYLCLTRGSPKEVRIIPGAGHMGGQQGTVVVLQWVLNLLGIQADAEKVLIEIPFIRLRPSNVTIVNSENP
ncbi:hypothetical protein DL764_002162 [Monosporascus ibericus]|uniref:AB hydrolase-1 domain-containing protein n=1 Tax=Monosporascus ibericus TaxID=155417 RepID=A0A4Q4TLL5_9PEZI|nr:hypothetical protein DL764_002162 [Monosporascus ibericus]